MATMMRKGGQRPRRRIKSEKTLRNYAAIQFPEPPSQEEIDRAFVGHFRNMVRGSPVGPATILMHLLFDALDRLKV